MFDKSLSIFRKLLAEKGIRNKDQLDELIDHYQTSLETKVDSGISYTDALTQATFELAQANHTPINRRPTWRIVGIISLILVMVVGYFAVANKKESHSKPEKSQVESTPNEWPLDMDSLSISSHFGMRKHPILKKLSKHKGIDIRARKGTPVLASSDGIVMTASYNKKMGNYVVIRHSERYSTRYMHLNNMDVFSCQRISAHTKIGTVGCTGNSTAPHLHFEILDYGIPVDPMDYLRP